MTNVKRTALIFATALVVAACSGDAAPQPEEPAIPDTESVTPIDPAPATEPTNVTEPEASTTSSVLTQAELEAAMAARANLRQDVSQATEPWPTDWSMASINLDELLLGIGVIDPRDIISPIDEPVYESTAEAAGWLEAEEPGALVQVEGEARFYPLSILHRHEVVNDVLGGVPVAVTYCPLCNTAITFDRRVEDTVLRFGVSGLLRNSDLIMWDDQSVSLWQQVTGEAVVGSFSGTVLQPISTAIVSFSDFSASFPDGLSLSRESSQITRYGENPYRHYSSRATPYGFFTGELDPRYPALSRVVGVTVGHGATGYPFEEISAVGIVNDTVGDIPVAVFWGGETRDALDAELVATGQAIGTGVAYLATVDSQVLTFAKVGEQWVDDQTGSRWSILGEAESGPLEGTRLEIATHRNEFWFAWVAFFPEGGVFEG